MDKKEFAVFSMALKTYYPKDNLLPTPEAMELWFRSLEDIPYKIAEVFLAKWVATEKWSPSIAEIRSGCISLTAEETADWSSGWEEVRKAIGRYGYMQEEKALGSMTPTTRLVVERLGWRSLCCSDNEVADRANFRTAFETISKRETEKKQLPPALRETIEKIQGGSLPLINA